MKNTAATKNDGLFEKVSALIKELRLTACDDHGLSEEELTTLSEINEDLVTLWDEYMDRMISEAASAVRNPEELVFQADADMDELTRAQERVRLKLAERGVPLGGTKKETVH